MPELTLEQQQAIAIARARVAANQRAAQNQKLTQEIQGNSMENFLKSGSPTGSPEPISPEFANAPVQPRPESDYTMPGEAAVLNFPKNVGKGIINFGTNLNTVGAAIADKSVELATGKNPGIAESYARNNPLFHGDTTGEQFTIGLGEALPGVTMGGKAGEAIGATVSGPIRAGLGSASKTFGNLTGSSAGYALGADKDQGTLTGDQLAVNPDDDFDTKQLKQTINIARDSLLTGIIAGGAGKAGQALLYPVKNLFYNIKNWNNFNTIQKDFMGNLLEKFTGMDSKTPVEQRTRAFREAVDYINNNKQIVESFGDPAIQDVARNKDTVSILTEGLKDTDPKQLAVKNELEGLRSSAISGQQAPNLQATLQVPKHELNRTVDDLHTSRGGNEAIEQTRSAIQQGARQEAEAARVPVDLAKQDLIKNQTGLGTALKSDEVFGPKFREAENGGVKLDIDKESLDKQTDIINLQHEAQQRRAGVRNAKYDVVGFSGAPANMERVNEVYETNKNNLPKDIQQLVEQSDGSFQYLNQKLKPQLSKAIDIEKKQPVPNGNTLDALYSLKRSITGDQLDFLEKSGNAETARLARDANTYNKKYSELHNDGLGGELKNISKKHLPNQPINYIENSRSTLMSAIKNPARRESIDQLRKSLGPEGEQKIADIALAESMKDITSGNDLGKITTQLQQMANSFTGKQRERIESFLTDIRDRKINIEQLQGRIKELQSAADEEEARIYNGHLKDFFTRNYKGEYDNLDNAQDIMDTIFRDKQSKSKIDTLIKKTENDPVARQGLQAAWAAHAKELINKTEDLRILPDTFLEYGKQITGNDKLINGIAKLNKEAKKIAEADKIRASKGFDTEANQAGMVAAIRQIMIFTFGLLSNAGARVNTINRDFLTKQDSRVKAKQAADQLLADPDVAINVGNQVIKELQNKWTPQQKAYAFRILKEAGLYSQKATTDDEQRQELRNQTEQNLKNSF